MLKRIAKYVAAYLVLFVIILFSMVAGNLINDAWSKFKAKHDTVRTSAQTGKLTDSCPVTTEAFRRNFEHSMKTDGRVIIAPDGGAFTIKE